MWLPLPVAGPVFPFLRTGPNEGEINATYSRRQPPRIATPRNTLARSTGGNKMGDNPQFASNGAAKHCAICGGQFGRGRHYSWRTALCSKKCVDQFRKRREEDRRWLPQLRAARQRLQRPPRRSFSKRRIAEQGGCAVILLRKLFLGSCAVPFARRAYDLLSDQPIRPLRRFHAAGGPKTSMRTHNSRCNTLDRMQLGFVDAGSRTSE
jgi:hypothetical protein